MFDLHCTSPACGKVTQYSDMANAALELLMNLSDDDKDFLGLSIEEVSDTDEGTGLKISKPLCWLGEGVDETMSSVEGQLTTPANELTTETMEELDEVSTREIILGFKAQLARMENELMALRKQTSRRDELPARRKSKGPKTNDDKQIAEWKSRAKTYQDQRDELRRKLFAERGQENAAAEKSAEARRSAAISDGQLLQGWNTSAGNGAALAIIESTANTHGNSEAANVEMEAVSNSDEEEPARWVTVAKKGASKRREELHP